MRPDIRAARNLARQQRLGVDTREISREDIREVFPECRTDDVGAAAWEPGSGYADPSATAFAFAAAAERLGVTIETGCDVTRILTERGRITGVETAGGRGGPVFVLGPGLGHRSSTRSGLAMAASPPHPFSPSAAAHPPRTRGCRRGPEGVIPPGWETEPDAWSGPPTARPDKPTGVA